MVRLGSPMRSISHRRLLGRVEEMRLVAIAGFQADRHPVFRGTAGDRLQRQDDVRIFLLRRRLARSPAERRIGDAAQEPAADGMRDLERRHEEFFRRLRVMRRRHFHRQAKRPRGRNAVFPEQRPRMLDVDDPGVEQRHLDQLKPVFGGLGDGQLGRRRRPRRHSTGSNAFRNGSSPHSPSRCVSRLTAAAPCGARAIAAARLRRAFAARTARHRRRAARRRTGSPSPRSASGPRSRGSGAG